MWCYLGMFIKCLFVIVFDILRDTMNVTVKLQNYKDGRNLKWVLSSLYTLLMKKLKWKMMNPEVTKLERNRAHTQDSQDLVQSSFQHTPFKSPFISTIAYASCEFPYRTYKQPSNCLNPVLHPQQIRPLTLGFVNTFNSGWETLGHYWIIWLMSIIQIFQVLKWMTVWIGSFLDSELGLCTKGIWKCIPFLRAV